MIVESKPEKGPAKEEDLDAINKRFYNYF